MVTGEPPEPVRVSLFVGREFFIFLVNGASFFAEFTQLYRLELSLTKFFEETRHIEIKIYVSVFFLRES